MITISVNISGNLRLKSITPRAVAKEGARGIYVEVVKSLEEMGRRSNSRYYWPEAVRTTTEPRLDGDVATISVTKTGVRLHWLGGKVKPTGAISRVTGRPIRSLLIPFRDSPIRRKALSEMHYPADEVMVLKSDNGRPYLAHVKPYKRKVDGKTAKVTPLGALVKQVTIKPNPDVIPTEATMYSAARAAILKHIDLMT